MENIIEYPTFGEWIKAGVTIDHTYPTLEERQYNEQFKGYCSLCDRKVQSLNLKDHFITKIHKVNINKLTNIDYIDKINKINIYRILDNTILKKNDIEQYKKNLIDELAVKFN